ncbi:hypothetical protein EV715DRAFT_266977 [Schizophyllum commune]
MSPALCCETTSCLSSFAATATIVAVPRLRHTTREPHSWETGGIKLDTTAGTRRETPMAPSTMQNEYGDGYSRHVRAPRRADDTSDPSRKAGEGYFLVTAAPQRSRAAAGLIRCFSRTRTAGGERVLRKATDTIRVVSPPFDDLRTGLGEGGANGLVAKGNRDSFPLDLWTARGQRVLPSVKDARGVEHPYPSRGIGQVPSTCLALFADVKPPEACARTLGEGRERGGAPLPPARAARWREAGRKAGYFVEGNSWLTPRRVRVGQRGLCVSLHAKEKRYTHEKRMPRHVRGW